MKLTIRQELPGDYEEVEKLIECAFKEAEHTDNQEHHLVKRLRNSADFIEELSLVVEQNGQIIGHILATKLCIISEDKVTESLALAPVSVLPAYQNMGVGSMLINEMKNIAKKNGFSSLIVLGHPKYYPRFGFVPASCFSIKAPFKVPDEAFMACELVEGSLKSVSGTVQYAKEFFE